MTRTRFAPSPTGPLHLGHAYAAFIAHRMARETGGQFLVRMEDLDRGRVREAWIGEQLDDLAWLGFTPDEAVIKQSDRLTAYQDALAQLREENLLYPCFCTRKEIKAEIEAASSAPHALPGQEALYPGLCRQLSDEARRTRLADGAKAAWRLDADKAIKRVGPLTWTDRARGKQMVDARAFGDVVLARKDDVPAYHLAVTLDDARSEIELVTRGRDLFPVTAIHRLLQALFDLSEPEWYHHPLVVDEKGNRLAKRCDSMSLNALKQQGRDPDQLIELACQRLEPFATE